MTTMQPIRRGLVLAGSLLLGVAAHAAPVTSAPDPLVRPAEVMPKAPASLLLDLVQTGGNYVVVGERGHVLRSSDGNEWVQVVDVPLRVTLTAVTGVDQQLWAVGHDGTILHSSDGGLHWQTQRHDPWHAPAEDASDDNIRQGVPLLDVLFSDAEHGFAVGAYALLLATSDGGKTWQEVEIHGSRAASSQALDEEEHGDEVAEATDVPHSDVFSAAELQISQEPEPHLNAIARTGSGGLVIVGERGAVFRSRDDGKSWVRSQLPYDGSMFGVLGFEGERVLSFGLRGNVFESTDLGENWNRIPTDTQLSLMGGRALVNGGAVIVGANGVLLRRAQAGAAIETFVVPSAGVISGVAPVSDSADLLVTGENGVRRYHPK
ncbi:MAG: YCF48-related protein [Dokdonella sp.]